MNAAPFPEARTFWLAPLLIAALTFAAYAPVIQNGFIFDDDLHITQNPSLASPDGYRRIWSGRDSFQYYPLTFSAFKLQRSLWGLNPMGFHLFSVALQSAIAIAIGVLLLRMSVPGAWWVAALFAVHPVHAETVAWATEQKNLFCMLFALAATDRWLAYRANERSRDYALSLGAYAACMLSKTAACLLPFVFIAIDWRQKKPVDRKVLLRLAPFLAFGAVMSLVTVVYERKLLGSESAFASDLLERPLIVGRTFWFYLGKLIWPAELSFTYQRWAPDAGSPSQWLAPAAALALFAIVWRRREALGRSPAAALVCYLLLLFPVNGIFPNYSNRYSFVADHYVYFASLPLLALVPAALARALANKTAHTVALLSVMIGFAAATHARVPVFRDAQSLWRDTTEKSPDAWMAWYNLGSEDLAQGRWREAAEHSERAVQLVPGLGIGWFQLGMARWRSGDRAASDYAFARSLRVSPDHGARAAPRMSLARTYLGISAIEAGRSKEAVEHFRLASELAPDCSSCWINLARAHAQSGDRARALEPCRRGLTLDGNEAAAAFCRTLR